MAKGKGVAMVTFVLRCFSPLLQSTIYEAVIDYLYIYIYKRIYVPAAVAQHPELFPSDAAFV